VESAAVVFHPIRNNKDEGGMELKTNEDGKATIDVIPVGDTVRLQIIKTGFETFGNDYPVDTNTKEIVVKLRPPARQYSIYEKHNQGQLQGGPLPPDTKPNPDPDSKTPDAKPQPQGNTDGQNGAANDTPKPNDASKPQTTTPPPQQ
jgi:hypothetical protein